MNKTVIAILLIMMIGNVAVLGETKKQDTAVEPNKPYVLWKWGTDLAPTDVNDIVDSDSFFLIPTKSGALTCVDFQSGLVKWSYLLGNQQLKKPVVANNNIILSGDKTIVCLNEFGKEVWKKNFEHLSACFFVYRKYLIFMQDALITCLDSNNGRTLWEQRVADNIYYRYEIVQLVDGLLYVVPSAFSPVIIKCLDPATGKLVFEHRFEEWLSLHSNLAIGQSRIVYVKGSQSRTNLNRFIFVDYSKRMDYYKLKFECLDAKTGKVLWTKPCDFNFNSEYENDYSTKAIRIYKNTFFVEDHIGMIHSFDLKDGSAKYSFKKNELLIGDDRTYFYKNERIITRDPETGKEIIVSSTFGSAKQSITLDNSEFVYLITVDNKENGQFRCFTKNNDNSLENVWSREFSGYFGNAFTNLQWKYLAIVGTKTITCFELEKGNKIWDLPISTSEFSMNPLITANHVFTFRDTEITCHDKRDGNPIWNYNTEKTMNKPALSNNESICFNTYENKIICLDQATGNQKWSFDSKRVLSMVQYLDSGHLLVKEEYDVFDLLDPNSGKLEHQFTNLSLRSILVDGNTFCGYFDNKVSFINTETKIITIPELPPDAAKILNTFADLDVDFWGFSKNKLLISVRYYDNSGKVTLVCYNAKTFEEIWSIRINEPSSEESIQVLDGKILLSDKNILYLMNLDNGDILWQRTLNTHYLGHYSINPDYVYAINGDKAVCFSADTGKTMWVFEDKTTTTQTGSYQDEIVLCSYGSMTFLKGNLPVKAVSKPSSFSWEFLLLTLIILILLACIAIVLRKAVIPKH